VDDKVIFEGAQPKLVYKTESEMASQKAKADSGSGAESA